MVVVAALVIPILSGVSFAASAVPPEQRDVCAKSPNANACRPILNVGNYNNCACVR